MNNNKQQYLDRLRANTAYPTYRGVIGLITVLGYALAGLQGLAALITGFGMMGPVTSRRRRRALRGLDCRGAYLSRCPFLEGRRLDPRRYRGCHHGVECVQNPGASAVAGVSDSQDMNRFTSNVDGPGVTP
jgi:hypothetical protein